MAYQRWGKPGRYYIWMGPDGLHVSDVEFEGALRVFLEHGPAGVDNAKALMRGLNDFLVGEGCAPTIRKGEVTFR
jgi:hypothetical protein